MKIGILGGTFDPIHLGHLYVARNSLKILNLNHVLLMVAHAPPHKAHRQQTSPFDRYAMVSLELLEEPHLYPCLWELERGSLSYTIDTLNHFSKTNPDHQYCFLAGSDSLAEIHVWKEHEALIQKHCFLFVQRPGNSIEIDRLQVSPQLKRRVRWIDKKDRPEIRPGHSYLVHLDPPPVSGTEVRKLISSGLEPPPEMISSRVLQYVRKQRLYETSQ